MNSLLNSTTCGDIFPDFDTQSIAYLCTKVSHETSNSYETDQSITFFNEICCRNRSLIPLDDEEMLFKTMNVLCNESTMNQTEELFCSQIANYMIPLWSKSWSLVDLIILSLFTPIGILANALILFAFYKFRNLRRTSGYFICNLAVSDILLVLNMLIYKVMVNLDKRFM